MKYNETWDEDTDTYDFEDRYEDLAWASTWKDSMEFEDRRTLYEIKRRTRAYNRFPSMEQ